MENKVVLGLDDIEVQNTTLEEIDAESINLVGLYVDGSGSMHQHVKEMQRALLEFKDALTHSKEKDEILIARGDFNNTIKVGGYKKIGEFETGYNADGMTALYDVIVEGKEKLVQYMAHLRQSGMRVKAVFAVFSDGEDTCSKNSVSAATKAIQYLNDNEIVTAFISFGGDADDIAQQLNFKNILKSDGTASELRKAFACLSSSVITASKSVIAPVDDFFTI